MISFSFVYEIHAPFPPALLSVILEQFHSDCTLLYLSSIVVNKSVQQGTFCLISYVVLLGISTVHLWPIRTKSHTYLLNIINPLWNVIMYSTILIKQVYWWYTVTLRYTPPRLRHSTAVSQPILLPCISAGNV